MLTRWQFFMEVLGRSGAQTEKQVEKGHVRALLILSLIILALVLLSGIPIATEYHEHAAIVVLVIIGIIAASVFVYWMGFEGFYQRYREEAQKAETATHERDQTRIQNAALEQDRIELRAMADASKKKDMRIKQLETALADKENELTKKLEIHLNEQKALCVQIVRWIESGERIVKEIEDYKPRPTAGPQGTPSDFPFPIDLERRAMEWQLNMEAFIHDKMPSFPPRLHDHSGLPSLPPFSDERKTANFSFLRSQVSNRVERIRELLAKVS